MTLEEMREKKKEHGYSLEYLATLSDVPLSTLRKIFSGQTRSPRRETMERLTAVLQDRRSSGGDVKYGKGTEYAASKVYENKPAYAAAAREIPYTGEDIEQGRYTIDDYLALPEERRCELIDGVFYDMASPLVVHQLIAGYLYYQLMSCAEKSHAQCRPYIAPLDVQLDKDNRTMVQPDVIICCHEEQDSGGRIFGAPDFLAEVVSPSSRQRDRFIKYLKYKNAGVREYWLIETERMEVIVYSFDKDDEMHLYSFDDDIPVGISEGNCVISFREIKQRVAALNEKGRNAE
ncbi:MAG: Uma2 family endonuclease [Firmicutes bacterium]|nr:Uma2 family endonuclease [Bacillota bacterium]